MGGWVRLGKVEWDGVGWGKLGWGNGNLGRVG